MVFVDMATNNKRIGMMTKSEQRFLKHAPESHASMSASTCGWHVAQLK
jgi:hypothetical protein